MSQDLIGNKWNENYIEKKKPSFMEQILSSLVGGIGKEAQGLPGYFMDKAKDRWG